MLSRSCRCFPGMRRSAIPMSTSAPTTLFTESRSLPRRLSKPTRLAPLHTHAPVNLKTSLVSAKPWTGKKQMKGLSAEPAGFIYVAVDGDSCPFHQDVMVKGRRGGWKAAEILVKEIKSLFGLASDDLTDVIVQIFLNQRGHTSYGWNKYRIHKEVAEAFFEGLNQADPLLNVVNVGQLKEAADMKIRAGLDFHLRLPGCRKIALAGLNDGAYAGMLRSFITRGQGNKVILLKTSDDIAVDIKQMTIGLDKPGQEGHYGLPVVSLPADLFQPRKLPPPPPL